MDALPSLWALSLPARQAIESRLRNGETSIDFSALAKQAAASRRAHVGGRTAGIPIYGILNQRPTWWSFTSTSEIVAELAAAVADSAVEAIVLDIDSPGGGVHGIEELSNAIYAARSKKPIYAVANPEASSAAYWAGSAATRMYAAPGADVGSIGVYGMHVDVSGLNEKLGIKPTYISAGKYKIEGNPDEPLTPEARANFQAGVNEAYRDFLRQVARNRGTTYSDVKLNYGEGRSVGAREAAAKVGKDPTTNHVPMIDNIATLEEVVKIARGRIASSDRRQAADLASRRARWATIKNRKFG